ncbi:type ISP restriction/modification enzyme [Streptomyces sp. SAI-097]
MGGDQYGWLRAAVSRFGEACKDKLSGGGGPEAAIRGPLEVLLRVVSECHEQHRVSWHDEYPLPDLGVRPDYAVSVNGKISGYVELKRPGLPVDPENFGRGSREQWHKLRGLPNLLYSNGTEWRLFRGGRQVGEPVYFAGSLHGAGGKLAVPDPLAFDLLLQQFLDWHPEPIRHVARLVQEIARLCRLLRAAVQEQLRSESRSSAPDDDVRARPFTGLKNDWRRYLFPSADDATFADGFAQTVTFSLLLAHTEGIPLAPDSLHEIGRRLDDGHALMGKALQLLTDNVNARFTVTLDLLTRTVAQVDWPAVRSGNRDAYLHLYEHFLTVYDPALRQKSGSYYTPREVVGEMIRLTEDVLRTRLDREHGFADEDVRIVDPAMGTGTFLHTVSERVAEQAAERHGPAMTRDAVQRLASRLGGLPRWYADPAQGRRADDVEFPTADKRRIQYVSHIGGTLPEQIRHDAEAETLYIGGGAFTPVSEAVWTYDVGGMPIVKKWFGYRKASPNSKKTSPLDDIHVDAWPAEWTEELIELLSVLRRLTDLEPSQDALLTAVLVGPVVTEGELRAAGVLPVPPAARKARHPALDGLFPDV